MHYIEKNISSDENFESMIQQHWIIYCNKVFIISLILSPFTYGISLLPLIYNVISIRTKEYGLTSKRVVQTVGIIGIKTDELRISKIETVEVKQSAIGRILSYGNVHMTGTGISNLIFTNVSNPSKVKTMIDSVIGREQGG